MTGAKTAVVTGAYSYTGAAVARSLMQRGYTVRTLTNRSVPVGDPGAVLETHPLQFADRGALAKAMLGSRVFVNTYWVRYPYVGTGFDHAVRNSGVLFEAAQEAGVRRIVQVSVSNASLQSPLAYYAGKAQVEALLRASGVSYGIVRPTLVVGERDILVNNIAWFLRRFPVFAMPGSGSYRLQPVTLHDAAEIIAESAMADDDVTVDAAGPEIVTFEALVRQIGAAVGRMPPVVHVPEGASLALLGVVGRAIGEVILSREELAGLTTEMLVSHEAPRGTQSVDAWLHENGAMLGRTYASEIRRHVTYQP
jgi:NADH dehydrogenase